MQWGHFFMTVHIIWALLQLEAALQVLITVFHLVKVGKGREIYVNATLELTCHSLASTSASGFQEVPIHP